MVVKSIKESIRKAEIYQIMKTLCKSPCDICSFYGNGRKCVHEVNAERLYNAGYRKRADIIREFAEGIKGYYAALKGSVSTATIIYYIDQKVKEEIGEGG